MKDSNTGAKLRFGVFRQRYEQGSNLVTAKLPLAECTQASGSERLTQHIHILEMNGDSCRLRHSQQNAASRISADPGNS